ncbi:MAG: CRTAC1 family protein [Phycisphaerales bacterium]
MMSQFAGRLGSCAVLMLVAGSAFAGQPLVSDQTDAVGLGTPHASLETTFGVDFFTPGGAAGDFDNDGDQDLFIIGGSASSDQLYINDGSGSFTDQAAAWGVARVHKGSGAAVGDFDNDGWLDLMVTSLGPASSYEYDYSVLYRNNGDGTFTDVTATAGVGAGNNSFLADAMSPAFGDYDLDGDLDLAVAGWYGGGSLYRNNGDGTFTDVTLTALDFNITGVSGLRGYAPRFVDMDGDRYPELLFVADFETSKYFRNDGDGTFTNLTPGNGTGLDSNGMGNTFGDYNNDGIFDWYVTSRIGVNGIPGPGASGNLLYMGTGTPHEFVEQSVSRGVNFGYWGWGALSIDIDHDGDQDIFATNGMSNAGLDMTPSRMYLNDGTGNFADIAAVCGMTDAGQGRGVIHADFDGDNDQDIVLLNSRQKHVYYRNDLSGNDINAITLRFNTSAVDGLAPNGFGTRVELSSDSGNQLRYMDAGSNYLSQSELSIHFGIGSDADADLTIKWANGDVTNLVGVKPGIYTIRALVCAADLSGDGNLNFFDVSAFLTMYQSQHPQADMNGDGLFNFFDVSAFLVAYQGGCP